MIEKYKGGIMWWLMDHFDLSCDGAGKSSKRWLPGVPASPVPNKDDMVTCKHMLAAMWHWCISLSILSYNQVYTDYYFCNLESNLEINDLMSILVIETQIILMNNCIFVVVVVVESNLCETISVLAKSGLKFSYTFIILPVYLQKCVPSHSCRCRFELSPPHYLSHWVCRWFENHQRRLSADPAVKTAEHRT